MHSVQGTLGQIAPWSTVKIIYDGKYNDREGCILNVSVMMYGSSQGKYWQPVTIWAGGLYGVPSPQSRRHRGIVRSQSFNAVTAMAVLRL